MCLDCGCLLPLTGHGDDAHITLTDLAAAADASGLTIAETAWNIPATLTATTSQHWPPGQPPITGKPVLCFDMDGVLAYTAEACCAALNARYGTTHQPHDQTFFPGQLNTAALPMDQAAWLAGQLTGWNILGTCAPDRDATRCLLDAQAAGYPVMVVTARNMALEGPTIAWLRSWDILPLPRVHCTGTAGKPAWMTARFGPHHPAVLIDDNPAVRATIARPGVETWLPARPYNQTPVGRPGTRTFTSWATARYWLGLGPYNP